MKLEDEGRPEDDVAEELQFHLEGRTEELMADGLTRTDAQRRARAQFGSEEAVAAECVQLETAHRRRQSRRSRVDALRLDLRLAWRGLLKDRGVAAAVVLTLGLTIGAVSALFSVTDALLLKPLPYPEDDQLVFIWQNDRLTGTDREPAGTADFYDFRERGSSFSAMSMYIPGSVTLSLPGGARYISTAQVHHDLLDVMGLQPTLGRNIRPEETLPGGPKVLLLSEALWESTFDREAGVIGRTLSLGDVPHQVVGILPAGASTLMGPTDAWVPLQITPAEATRSPHSARVVARMRTESSVESAQVEMTRIAADLENEVDENANRGAFVETASDYLRGDLSGTVWTVFGATLVLLLIGAANVVSLLSARATRRARATAVHTALGSGPSRTFARGLVESALLLVAAIGVGVASATVGLRALEAAAPPDLRALGELGVDLRVFGFTLLLSAILTSIFALVPASQALRQDLRQSLGHGAAGGQRRNRGQLLLVVGQSAMATVLLVGALLLGQTVRNLMSEDLGFDTESVLRASIVLPDARYPRELASYPNYPEVFDFQNRLLADLNALPGVHRASVVSNHPLDEGFTNSFRIEGRMVPEGVGEITTRIVSPSYFETASVEFLEGRGMSETLGPLDDGEILLNATAASVLFPDGDALGQRIAFWGPTFRTVVGVVEDERFHGHRADAPLSMYASILQLPILRGPTTVLIRVQGDPAAAIPQVQRTILEIEPGAAVYDVSTMDQTLRGALLRERFASTLLTAFSAIALLLAAIGVHGVLAFSVARRRREIGVRLALGARRGQVRARVLRQAVALVGSGVAIGLVLALLGSRAVDVMLFGVTATSPILYVAAGTIITGVGALGALHPAFRASGVEPTHSLKAD